MGVIHRARGRAPIDRRDPAGVAVGQQAHGFAFWLLGCNVPNQSQTVFADLSVDFDVFIRDVMRQLERRSRTITGGQGPQCCTAPVQCPSQVDCRRAGRVQAFPCRIHIRVRRIKLHRQRHAIGSGCANQWGTAHAHFDN